MPLDVGIYDMPAATYHADPCEAPSLSASIATRICLASPLHAFHAHPRLNPAAVDEESDAFDLGTAAHALLLQHNRDVVIIQADNWRTKDAREARDHARAAGQIPLLARVWADVLEMATTAREQLDAHTDGGAAMFLDGQAEQTLIWREDDLWCRARLDWLRPGAIDDYKSTSASANPDTWSRTLFSHGFDLQAAWYLRGLRALTGIDAIFRFAVQETSPPYALSVVGLGPDALLLAEKKCLYALEVWRAGLATGDWPGYPTRTAWATLPAWEEARWLEKELR